MKEHPQAHFSLHMCSSQEVIQKIAVGDADFGISDTVLTHEGIRFETALEMNAVCILRRDDPLAEQPLVAPVDLAARPMVCLSRSFSSRFAMERIFDKASVTMEIAAEVTTSYNACGFISDGLGVGVLSPFPVLDGPFSDLVARPFTPEFGYRTRLLTPANARPSWLAQTFSAFLIHQSSVRLNHMLARLKLTHSQIRKETL